MAKHHLSLVTNQVAYRRKPGKYLTRPILTWYHGSTNLKWISNIGHSSKPDLAIKAATGRMLLDEKLQVAQVFNAFDKLLARISRTASGDLIIRRYH